jgi:hypothetical protein
MYTTYPSTYPSMGKQSEAGAGAAGHTWLSPGGFGGGGGKGKGVLPLPPPPPYRKRKKAPVALVGWLVNRMGGSCRRRVFTAAADTTFTGGGDFLSAAGFLEAPAPAAPSAFVTEWWGCTS